ncbi:MAG: zinc ABC transporter substrate-binding protein, partial [Bacteroidota bacterium]
MRKYIPLLLLLLTTTAWGQKKLVLGTASIFSDMAKVIGGDLIEVRSIVPIGGDPHTYQPTPSDVQLVNGADLILQNGLTFEGWLNELIANSGTEATRSLITEGVKPIASAVYENSADPHAWMDPKNGLIYIENIKDALTALIPEEAAVFEFNYKLYAQQIRDLDVQIDSMIQSIEPAKRVLITSHDAFQYFGRRYGLELQSILGISTESEAKTSDVIRLGKVIKERQVPAVFIETTVNPKLLKQIAADNNVRIGGSLFSDSIGDENSEAPTYLDMLEYNARTITAGLTSPPTTPSSEPEETTSLATWILLGILVILLFGALIVMIRRLNA